MSLPLIDLESGSSARMATIFFQRCALRASAIKIRRRASLGCQCPKLPVGVVSAALAALIAACSPSAAQKSDEKVCEELVAPLIIDIAREVNEESILKELNTGSGFNVDMKTLVSDKKITTLIIQKRSIQVSCLVTLNIDWS